MSLWTADEIAEAAGGEVRGDPGPVTGISIDSRTLSPGDLFVALTDARDGHEFVAAALEAGAAAALVSRVPEGLPDGAPLILAPDDPLAALTRLAETARARSAAKVIAVTGSVGKTSTKEMLRAMLSAQGRTHAAEKSYNNHWGVPLTLARMPADTEWAVIEVGMNHAGEIGPLSRLARPDVAIVTTVEAVHLENFDSVEGIADAKAEIIEGVGPDGIVVLNRDNPHFARIAGAADGRRVIAFGQHDDADYRLLQATVAGDATVMRAEANGAAHCLKIGAPGVHMAMNALAALAAVTAAGADPAKAGLALASWAPPSGRGVRWRILLGDGGVDGEITLFDESYNANPVSMRAALAVLAGTEVTDGVGRIDRGRRIAFLGDMLELGTDEQTIHAHLADAPELANVDRIHTAGPRMRALHDALPPAKRGEWFPDSRDLADRARRTVDAGDVCMVKGSLGSAMVRVVDALKSLGHAVDARSEARAEARADARE